MICVQYGPITIAVRSTTRTPASGPARLVGLELSAPATLPPVPLGPIAQLSPSPLRGWGCPHLRRLHVRHRRRAGHLEAVADVVSMTVGYDGKHQGRRRVADGI